MTTKASGVLATLMTVEEFDDGFHPVIEGHRPCLDPYGADHAGCTVVARCVGPARATLAEAIDLLEHSHVRIDGRLIPRDEWEASGS